MSVVGSATVSVRIANYTISVDFLVVHNLYHKVIFGLDMLRDNNAVIDISNLTLSLADNLVTVPLLRRFAPRNILRTVSSITIAPFHEVRLPVRISPNYMLGPSIVEPLLSKHSSALAVAKIYVEPQSRTTVCQVVNLSPKPFTLPTRTAIATITPADLLSSPSTSCISAVSQDVTSTTLIYRGQVRSTA